MVQGLKFLSKKGFNPANKSNQKRVWEAEQEKRTHAVRLQERQAQLRREREDEELARAQGREPKLGFMYTPPPGWESGAKTAAAGMEDPPQTFADSSSSSSGPETTTTAAAETTTRRDLSTQRQPGDDDAAAAFRLLLAQREETTVASAPAAAADIPASTTDAKSAFGSTVLQGSSAPNEVKKIQLTALEKAVGRNKDTSALTLDEQIQRFPALANAPRAKGMTATDVGASFKPLGTQIRNVKCLACGIWGHSRGDRECELSGWNPFATKPTANSASGSEEGLNKRAEPKSTPNGTSALEGEETARKQKRKREVDADSDDDSSLSSYGSRRNKYDKDDSSSYERDRRRRHKKHKKSYRKRDRRHRSRSPASRKHKSSSRRSEEDREKRRRKHRSHRDR